MTSMRPLTRTALLLALFATATAVTPAARADESVQAATLASECANLRGALDRANAEISALKRSERGVRDDYRLRKKMAEAEALARRLTEAEARLRSLRGPAPAPAPAADPADAPALLEARADILSDEARRLGVEAAALGRAAEQLRARQVLRRRAGQMEQDPFASVETPKRQMFVTGARPTTGGAAKAAPQDPGSGKPNDSATPTRTDPAPPTTPMAALPGGPKTSDTPGAAVAPPGQGSTPAPKPEATGQPTLAPPPPPPPPGAAPSPIARALIDPAAVAELRRAEAAGQSLTDAEKMGRAAAALRARMAALEAEAAALRARAARR